MIDRAALVLPRLPRSGHATEQALNRLLHALRIGLSVRHLRRTDMPPEINALLYQLTTTSDTAALRERLAAAIGCRLPAADEQTRQVIGRLVDLHCALRGPDDGQ